MRGNLVELAVAFIMGGAFATVVTSFTKIIMELLAKAGGQPNFDAWKPWGLSLGPFLTALIAFLILSFVIYFGIVKPYEHARDLMKRGTTDEEEAAATEVEVLSEIRDLLAANRGTTPTV